MTAVAQPQQGLEDPPSSGAADGLRHLRWGAGFVSAGALAASIGLAPLVQLAYAPLAALAAVWLLARGRHLQYVHLLLFLWVTNAGIRRLVDLHTGYHDASPVLLAAPVASVLAVGFCAFRRARLPGPFLAFLTAFGVAVAYALVVGALNVGLVPVLASFAAWGPPFLVGVYLAFFPLSPGRLAQEIGRTSWVYLALVGGYGVAQWVVAPPWDVAWMKAIYTSGFSFGTAEPFGIRVFSLVNSPYTLGALLVVLLAIQIAVPLTPPRLVAIVLGISSLGLSGVRAAWLVLVVVLVLLAVRRRLNPRTAALGCMGIVAAAASAPATFTSTVGDRLDSFNSGTTDASYAARDQFYDTVLPRLFTDPTGSGFGSTGAGVRTAGVAADSTFEDVDSTYIDLLRTFGPWFAVLVVVLLVTLIGWLWWRLGASREPPYAGWVAFLAAVPVLALLGDVFGGVVGLLVWSGLALSARHATSTGVGGPSTVSVASVPRLLGLGALVTVVALVLVLGDRLVPDASVPQAPGPCRVVRNDVRAMEQDRPVTAAGPTRAVVLGDSYTQGTLLDDPRDQVWATALGSRRGWTTYLNGIGGTGFVNPGACGNSTFAARVPDVLALRPDVVVVEGGLNDTGEDPRTVRRAAEDLLRRLDEVPRVIVVGPAPAPSQPIASAIDGELRAATVASGRQYVSVIDDDLPFLPDRLHLTASGHRQMADDIARELR